MKGLASNDDCGTVVHARGGGAVLVEDGKEVRMASDPVNGDLIHPSTCVCCGEEVEWHAAGYPKGAVICSTCGNFGSRVFDAMHDTACFAICDACFKRAAEHVLIYTADQRTIKISQGTLAEYLTA